MSSASHHFVEAAKLVANPDRDVIIAIEHRLAAARFAYSHATNRGEQLRALYRLGRLKAAREALRL